MSEKIILTSTNPQYDKRLFYDLPVQYMKTTSSEHVVYINCSECQNKNKKQFLYTTCSKLVFFMNWTGKSMNNLLSYCGLVYSWISASDKDLPATFDQISNMATLYSKYFFIFGIIDWVLAFKMRNCLVHTIFSWQFLPEIWFT